MRSSIERSKISGTCSDFLDSAATGAVASVTFGITLTLPALATSSTSDCVRISVRATQGLDQRRYIALVVSFGGANQDRVGNLGEISRQVQSRDYAFLLRDSERARPVSCVDHELVEERSCESGPDAGTGKFLCR